MFDNEKIFILVSPFCFHNEHTTFEAGFIQQLSTLQYSKIYFFGELSHCHKLATYFLTDSIVFMPVSSFGGRIIFGIRTLISVFVFSLFKRKKKIIFLSFEHPHILFIVSILFSKTYGCLHSGTALNPVLRIYKKIGLFLFSLRNKYFVLGEWIFDNLKQKRNVSWMYYPLYDFETCQLERRQRIVVFGGSQYKYKFVDFNLEKSIIHLLKEVGLEYIVLGKGGLSLDMNEYFNILQNSYFAIFISAPIAYTLRCSGSYFDCINAGLPTIGLDCCMTENIERKFGPTGFFYSTPDHLMESLNQLLHSPESELSAVRKNIHIARQMIKEENISRINDLLKDN